jgi:uncharacterized protein YecE (DUF72 family)
MPEKPDKPACRVWVGTSGYSYRDWAPGFYPKGLPAARMLSFYARRFNTVELNFTFYRIPVAGTLASMVRRTPPDFRFFAKVHQDITHGRDFSGVPDFLRGIEPLRDAGRLRGLLLQYPQRFKNTADNRTLLLRAASQFPDTPMAVEFRDRSWADEAAYRLCADHDLSVVAVDVPPIASLFPRAPVATADLAYVRLHSRNADNWYGEGPGDRYDYLYTEQELREWLPLLEIIAQRAIDLFVFFNNCHQAQAAENAEQMKSIIRESSLELVEPESPPPPTTPRTLWDPMP